MTYEEFRKSMELFRENADTEATAQKDPQLALDGLCALYENFDVADRLLADRVLIEWCLSTDAGKRFDALAPIEDYGVTSAAPALRVLASRLEISAEPGAPFELKRVERILRGLVSKEGS